MHSYLQQLYKEMKIEFGRMNYLPNFNPDSLEKKIKEWSQNPIQTDATLKVYKKKNLEEEEDNEYLFNHSPEMRD